MQNPQSATEQNPATRIASDIREEASGTVFESLEEAQAFLAASMDRKNNASVAEFQGLSPFQMHRLLHFPFVSPDVVRFGFDVSGREGTPALDLLALLVEGLGNDGAKTTQTGNLPRALCREVIRAHLGDGGYAEATVYGDFMGETDCLHLHLVRLTAGLAGLIRNNRGRLAATTACRRLVSEGDWKTLYAKLFASYIQKVNWAYPRSPLEVPFFSQSFAFSLYLLTRFGGELRSRTEYSTMYLEAFPSLLAEQDQPMPGREPGYLLRMAYESQVCRRFFDLFGLAIHGPDQSPNQRLNPTLRASPVLGNVVTFPSPGGA